MLTLQFGHAITLPQIWHCKKLWNPRRFRNTMLWPPDARFSLSAATRADDSGTGAGPESLATAAGGAAPLPAFTFVPSRFASADLRASAISRRISTISTVAIARSFTRRKSRISRYRPRREFANDSLDGVAEPRTTGHFEYPASATARSR